MKKIKINLIGENLSTNESEAHNLQNKSFFGEKKGDKIIYSLTEAMYLLEKNKAEIILKNKSISQEQAMKKFQKIDKKFSTKYLVFKDLRKKGYVVKTALKFGAEFRVYDKGSSPGKSHAKWVVFTDYETSKFSWQDFSAKNRIANSTNKKLLLAILDEEADVSYYEVKWMKIR